MGDPSDIDLVLGSKRGSREAFVGLFHRYKARILNYLYGYVGNYAAAQDLTQEAFIHAYEGLPGLKETGRFSSWLYAIATNLAKNYLLRAKRVKEESFDAPLDPSGDLSLGDVIPDFHHGPDEETERQMVQTRIQQTLDALGPLAKEVLLLCDVEGVSYEEAAEILGCKVGTVASRLSEARRKFREIFTRKGSHGNKM